MKKYLILALFLGVFSFKVAKADTTVFGFMDGKYYDASQQLVYFCFGDGSCFDIGGKQVLVTVYHPSAPVVADACPNIEGIQTTVPLGMFKDGNGNCVVQAVSIFNPPPAPSPTPVPTPEPTPTPAPSPVPVLLPAYTESELLQKFYTTYATNVAPPALPLAYTPQRMWPVSIFVSPTTATFGWVGDYDNYKNSRIVFGNRTVVFGTGTRGTVDSLSANTQYSYQFVYHEDGRQDTTIEKTFTTAE